MEFNDGIKPKMNWEVYARYFLTAKAIYEVCKITGLESPTVLEIGANGEKNLNAFLPEARITPLNINPENLNIKPENLIVADASNMYMIETGSYDFVISCAVLEHIPPELHKAVLSESFRVARYGVFHGAPQETIQVNQSERIVSNFHELLYKVKHRWLEEHLLNGHPECEKISSYCQELGFDYQIFQHMNCQLWTTLFCTYLEIMKYTPNFREYINTYYQRELFGRDFGISNIFMYLYISKSGPSASKVLENVKKDLCIADERELLNDFYDMQNHVKTVVSRVKEQLILDQQNKLYEQNIALINKMAEEKNELLQQLDKITEEKKQLLQQIIELKNFNRINEQTLRQYIKTLAEKEQIQKSLQGEVVSLKQKNKQIDDNLNALRQSTSWRMTRPLRKLADRLKALYRQ